MHRISEFVSGSPRSRSDWFVMDLFGNRCNRTIDKPSTAHVDIVITYCPASTEKHCHLYRQLE